MIISQERLPAHLTPPNPRPNLSVLLFLDRGTPILALSHPCPTRPPSSLYLRRTRLAGI